MKPFVASGFNEIRSNVKPAHWRHIPSEQNVADDISRGLSVPEWSELGHTPQSSFGDQKANGQWKTHGMTLQLSSVCARRKPLE